MTKKQYIKSSIAINGVLKYLKMQMKRGQLSQREKRFNRMARAILLNLSDELKFEYFIEK